MNILITGASRGIGAALAARFCTLKGSRILITARDQNRLNGLKNRLESDFPETEILVRAADLTEEAGLTGLTEWVGRTLSSLDILINNAGRLTNRSFQETSAGEALKMFSVNYFAPARLIRELAAPLEMADRPHVVNISSMGGFQGSVKFPGLAHYSASKAALAVLTECLAEEYKESGISFNCLALGSADTAMLREAFPGYEPPLTAEEMAGFICDFALNGHRFMNGKILPVSLSTP